MGNHVRVGNQRFIAMVRDSNLKLSKLSFCYIAILCNACVHTDDVDSISLYTTSSLL